MTLVLEIAPELAKQIQTAAQNAGMPIDKFVLESVTTQLAHTKKQAEPPKQVQRLSRIESQLLEQINQSMSHIRWEQYRELIAKRRAEVLTPEEHQELIRFSDQIEEANVNRITYVAELAKIQHLTLPAMMKKLGLSQVSYD